MYLYQSDHRGHIFTWCWTGPDNISERDTWGSFRRNDKQPNTNRTAGWVLHPGSRLKHREQSARRQTTKTKEQQVTMKKENCRFRSELCIKGILKTTFIWCCTFIHAQFFVSLTFLLQFFRAIQWSFLFYHINDNLNTHTQVLDQLIRLKSYIVDLLKTLRQKIKQTLKVSYNLPQQFITILLDY